MPDRCLNVYRADGKWNCCDRRPDKNGNMIECTKPAAFVLHRKVWATNIQVCAEHLADMVDAYLSIEETRDS